MSNQPEKPQGFSPQRSVTNESRPRMMPVHSPILQVQQNLRDAEKRIDELTKALDLMNERQRLEWARAENAEAKVDELATALYQLIAQINSSVSVISDSLRQDGDAYTVNVSTLAALGHMRDDVLKVLNDSPADSANLRDLLNASMAENAAMLQQVTAMQEALNEAQQAALSHKEMFQMAVSGWGRDVEELTKQLADAQASHHSAMFLLDEAQGDCNGWHDAYVALLWWSQDAYRKLAYHATLFPVPEIADMLDQESNADIVALLDGAPANVSAEVDPFSAELAADLNCTERDVYEYAVDSMGASGIKTIEGCHSAGLHSCYGELWLCQECGNFFCDAEGSDDGFIDFCDECWAKVQGKAA